MKIGERWYTIRADISRLQAALGMVRVRLDLWRVRTGDTWRWRLLRRVPDRWLYWTVIQALTRVLDRREHPDSVGALEVARRLRP